MGPTQADEIEEQNERAAEELAQKVSRLKNLAFDIEVETKDHLRLLHGMNDDFDGAGNLLSNSMNRVKKLLSSGRGSRKIMCYMSIFIFFFFIFVYYVSSRLFSTS